MVSLIMKLRIAATSHSHTTNPTVLLVSELERVPRITATHFLQSQVWAWSADWNPQGWQPLTFWWPRPRTPWSAGVICDKQEYRLTNYRVGSIKHEERMTMTAKTIYLPRFVEMLQDMPKWQPLYLLRDSCREYFHVLWDRILSRIFMWKTHRLTAVLMLSPKSIFWTAKSIKASTSSFNASAVTSRRESQRVSTFCISFTKGLAHSINIWLWTNFPIAQTSHHHQGDAGSAL